MASRRSYFLPLLALALALCLAFASAPLPTSATSTPETRAYIASRYGSSSHVGMVRGAIPRWGGPDRISADEEYLKVVILAVIPGAVFLVLTLLLWIGFTFANCCCKARPGGYTAKSLRGWLIFGFVCTVVIVAFSILGLYYNAELHDEVSGNKGLAATTLQTLDHTRGLFERVRDNMEQVKQNATMLAPAVEGALNQFTDLGTGLQGVTQAMSTLSQSVASLNPVSVTPVEPAPGDPTDPIVYNSPFLGGLPDRVNGAALSLDAGASDAYSQIESTKTATQQKVLDARDEIRAVVDEASNQVGEISDEATHYDGKVRDYEEDVDMVENLRSPISFAIFALPLLMCVLYWTLVLMKRSAGCSKLLIHLLFFTGFLTWIIFLIHLPVSLLVADSCHYLDTVDVDLQANTPLGDSVASPINACLSQQPLLAAMGVSNEFDFTESVRFPDFPRAEELLQRAPVAQLHDEVQALQLDTFQFDAGAKNTQLDALNQLTAPDVFTLDNVETCDPTQYGAQETEVRRVRSAVLTSLEAERQLNVSLADIKSGMASVTGQLNALHSNTEALLTVDMPRLETAVQPLLVAGNHVLRDSRCDPLDSDYEQMKGLFCDRMIVSISTMALAAFFSAIFCFFLNVACWFLQYRLQAPLQPDDGFGSKGLTSSGGDHYGAESGKLPSSVPPSDSQHAYDMEMATSSQPTLSPHANYA